MLFRSRLFLDEFVNRREIAINAMSRRLTYAESESRWEQNPSVAFEYIAEELKVEGSDPIFSLEHAESLYRRVFDEYGDDSVSQLGGVHIVFEQASNVVINEIEWGAWVHTLSNPLATLITRLNWPTDVTATICPKTS